MDTTTNFQKHTSSGIVQNYLIRNFNAQLLSGIRFACPDTILDAGCGEGFTMSLISASGICTDIRGIDNSDAALFLARRINPKLRISKASIYDIPFADNSIDLITCLEVLEHLDDPQKAVHEIIRVSKKYILLSVPNEPFFQIANFMRGKYLKSLGNHPEHINHWSTRSIVSLISAMGCGIVQVHTPFAWTMVLAKKS